MVHKMGNMWQVGMRGLNSSSKGWKKVRYDIMRDSRTICREKRNSWKGNIWSHDPGYLETIAAPSTEHHKKELDVGINDNLIHNTVISCTISEEIADRSLRKTERNWLKGEWVGNCIKTSRGGRGYEEWEKPVMITGIYNETVVKGMYVNIGREGMYANRRLRL